MFKNLNIGTRLAMGFGFVLAMLPGIGLSGYWGVNSISNLTVTMLQGDSTEHEAHVHRRIASQRPALAHPVAYFAKAAASKVVVPHTGVALNLAEAAGKGNGGDHRDAEFEKF